MERTYFEQGYWDGLALARVDVNWLLTLTEEERAEYHRGSKVGVNQRLGFAYHADKESN